MNFEEQVAATVAVVRNLLAQDDESPNCFHFKIVAEGRVRDGEVKITFSLGESDYSNIVTGDNVEAVITEYLRRIGWQARHDYLALPKAAE